MCKQRTNMI